MSLIGIAFILNRHSLTQTTAHHIGRWLDENPAIASQVLSERYGTKGLAQFLSGRTGAENTEAASLSKLNHRPVTDRIFPVQQPVARSLQPTVTPVAVVVTPTAAPSQKSITKLGHFPYSQADFSTLVKVGKYGDRSEKLSLEASIAWKQMVAAARSQNVSLVIISGFRSIETQTFLFDDHVRSRGSQAAAAKSVAPPGYSEHHTGYALDVGDGRAPGTDVTTAFAKTAAFRWLIQNAYKYGFELSFPSNNRQHVLYEPWHWRYVGSAKAIEIFMNAKQGQRG